jgi:hypothetical protein
MPTAETATTHFSNALAEMRDHYQSGTATPFDLEASPHVQLLRAADHTPPDSEGLMGSSGVDVDGELASIKAAGISDYKKSGVEQKDGATAASNQVQQDQDADSFIAKMNAQREKAKKDSDATIDKTYDAGIDLGMNATPAEQDAILVGMSTILGEFNTVLNAIVDAVSSIISVVSELIDGLLSVGEAVADGFASVGHMLHLDW